MMKKMMIFGMALAAGLALAACGAAGRGGSEGTKKTAISSEITTEAAGDDWYMGILSDKGMADKYPYYRLLDVNLDGVPELFLSTTEDDFIGGEDKAAMIALIDGKPQTLQEIGGEGGEFWVYNQSDATLSYYSRLSGEGHIVLYSLKDTGLSEISSADYYAPHHYSEKDNAKELYFIDNKEVSKKEGESYFEQYGNRDASITFDPVDSIAVNSSQD